MSLKINPNLEAELIAGLEPLLDKAAPTAADVHREHVSAGPRTGRKYPRLPRRSSASEEVLQEQFGAYRAAIGTRRQDELTRLVGVIDHPTLSDDALGALEFGNRGGTLAGRKSLTRSMESPATHEAMAAAIERSA